MEKDLKEVKEYYNQHYYHEEISNRIKEGVHKQLHRKPHRFGKKLFYFSGAAVAALGLFIGLAFFSPAVANVAAKIPFLNMLFESKPITEVIGEALTEKGYPFEGMGAQYSPKKIFSVAIVGSEEYVDEVRPKVKEIVRDLLLARNFDAYEIKIERAQNKYEEPTPEEKKAMEEDEKVFSVVEEVLKSFGYAGFSLSSDTVKKTVELNFPNTETRIEEIKQSLRSSLDDKGMGSIAIKVNVYNAKKKEREDRWMPIISTIAEGTFGSKEYKVKGVGYTNRYAEHMTITISTSVSSTDSDYEKVVKKIETTILEFLNSESTQKIIKDDAYKIIIRSKDKKEYVISSK